MIQRFTLQEYIVSKLDQRRPYAKPEMNVLGDLRTLTQAAAPGLGDGPTGDAGFPPPPGS